LEWSGKGKGGQPRESEKPN